MDLPHCLFYSLVNNWLIVLSTSKFKLFLIWPVGSYSSWFPCLLKCLHYLLSTFLLSDTRYSRPYLVLSVTHPWDRSLVSFSGKWNLAAEVGMLITTGVVLSSGLLSGQNEGICICVCVHTHVYVYFYICLNMLKRTHSD